MAARVAAGCRPRWETLIGSQPLPVDGFPTVLSSMRIAAAQPGSFAEHIIRRMYRPIDLGNQTPGHAVAETEHPFAGDTWFWTDDNAKVLEFLAHPELIRSYPTEAAELFRFLRAMCRPPFVFRRFSLPRLEPAGQEGAELRFHHSLMHLRCNLQMGAVVAGIRFHDDRTANNVLLSANSVEFSHRGRRFTLDVAAAIEQVDVSQHGNILVLRHCSELRFKPRLSEMRLGRVTYSYEINAHSMLIGVEVALEVDPGADVADVVLTIGHDHLSHGLNSVSYKDMVVAASSGPPQRFSAGGPGRDFLPAAGARYYAISQNEMAGFALAVHSSPRAPERLAAIETLVLVPGSLHLVRARYRFDGPCRGARLVAGEDKLLTSGGFYDRIDDYARLIRDAVAMKSLRATAYDFSVSYDYGAELNAFACYFASLSSRHSANGAARMKEEVHGLFDKFLGVYFDLFVRGHERQKNTIFSRQLAFVVLGVLTMYEVTGAQRYLDRLAQLCEVLLAFEKRYDDIAGAPASGFMMGIHSKRFVFIDCHSAALLALTKAARYIDDSRLAAVIDRGLGSYCIETTKIDWIDGPHKADVVAASWVDDQGVRLTNNAFWNYQVGLTLRFFAALRNSPDSRLRKIAARHRDRMELCEMIMLRQIEKSLSRYDGAIEIRTSVLSAETNSETQPWATLGLLDIRA